MRENLSQRIADLEAQNRILRELEKENRRFIVEIVENAFEVANSSALVSVKKNHQVKENTSL